MYSYLRFLLLNCEIKFSMLVLLKYTSSLKLVPCVWYFNRNKTIQLIFYHLIRNFGKSLKYTATNKEEIEHRIVRGSLTNG